MQLNRQAVALASTRLTQPPRGPRAWQQVVVLERAEPVEVKVELAQAEAGVEIHVLQGRKEAGALAAEEGEDEMEEKRKEEMEEEEAAAVGAAPER